MVGERHDGIERQFQITSRRQVDCMINGAWKHVLKSLINRRRCSVIVVLTGNYEFSALLWNDPAQLHDLRVPPADKFLWDKFIGWKTNDHAHDSKQYVDISAEIQRTHAMRNVSLDSHLFRHLWVHPTVANSIMLVALHAPNMACLTIRERYQHLHRRWCTRKLPAWEHVTVIQPLAVQKSYGRDH